MLGQWPPSSPWKAGARGRARAPAAGDRSTPAARARVPAPSAASRRPDRQKDLSQDSDVNDRHRESHRDHLAPQTGPVSLSYLGDSLTIIWLRVAEER